MASTTFTGSDLLLQDDLLHEEFQHVEEDNKQAPSPHLDRLASSIRQAFAGTDQEGALLVLEIDHSDDFSDAQQAALMDHVSSIASGSIRRFDPLEQIDEQTIAIGLPGSGRIGMTRVADAIRQRVGATSIDQAEGFEDTGDPGNAAWPSATTVTIGAVHTTEANLVDLDDLLLAARVNLDAARAAGRNRTNWSDWSSLPD
jgi:GGDEF domain-containing protein